MGLASDMVVIHPYDPVWPQEFAREREALLRLFAGEDIVVEHVGSTAVPGVGAKPIIDMMLGVADIRSVERHTDSLGHLDYGYRPEYEKFVPERRFFRKPQEGKQRFHLHCVCKDTDFFRDHILFRDTLRNDAQVAAEYLALKQELAEKFRNDRAAYTDANAVAS
jgi:GrpB-like predicted nucleotidyltransferase (UPF0157 family)